MKNCLMLFIIVALFSSCVVSSHSNMAFVKPGDIDDKAKVVAINPPLFLVKPFVTKALKEDNDGKEIGTLVKKIKKLRVLTISEGKLRNPHRLKAFLRKNNYEEWVSINSEGQLISISAKMDNHKKTIQKLLIAVQSTTDQVFVDIKGNLSLDDISSLINMANKSDIHPAIAKAD